MLSFSTCWNSARHTEGEALVEEIAALGFDSLEISHGLKVSLLPGIKKAFEAGRIKISGLHNFCPSPVEVMIDAPDVYEFTSHRPHERERAMALTLKTLEFAAQFQARYLVLHLGSVPLRKFTAQLEEIARAGRLNTREYVRLKLRLVEAREKVAPLYLSRAREALEQIAEKAKIEGVPVAVESRSHFEQVPTEREMEQLMDHFQDNPWVGYWHDFGHVQRKHNLGLLDHLEWIRRMQAHWLGCHLHDVKWPARDHRVPLTAGGVDFDQLMPHVPLGKPVVWEISSRRRKETILEMLPQWRQKFGEPTANFQARE
ncbi:MAG: sugar phosphate isomerase/epimerase family protein [Verrucomicrobiales bacterium]